MAQRRTKAVNSSPPSSNPSRSAAHMWRSSDLRYKISASRSPPRIYFDGRNTSSRDKTRRKLKPASYFSRLYTYVSHLQASTAVFLPSMCTPNALPLADRTLLHFAYRVSGADVGRCWFAPSFSAPLWLVENRYVRRSSVRTLMHKDMQNIIPVWTVLLPWRGV